MFISTRIFRISQYIPRKIYWILVEITLNFQLNLGEADVFTLLSSPNREHNISLHLFESPLMICLSFLFRILLFFLYHLVIICLFLSLICKLFECRNLSVSFAKSFGFRIWLLLIVLLELDITFSIVIPFF